MTRARLVAAAFLAVALVALMPGRAGAQCAMCRTVLASPEGQKLIAGLRGGILLLLAAPFSIFATIAALAVRMQRHRMAAAAGAAAAHTGHQTITEPASAGPAPL